jgi:DNA-binding GntR family transcriptional regulator
MMRLFIPQIQLDRDSAIPLHRQIYRQIADSIRGGAVPRDARLPSTRLAAKIWCVSRNTVLAAYEELAADDLVRASRGVGMQVNNGLPVPPGRLGGLRRAIRAAHYPAGVQALADPDGNPLYLNQSPEPVDWP